MSKYLSDINANKTFKNILRGNIDQGVLILFNLG